jgi:23S rRNA (cytidine1920-2'-O)/16S rRNA (cytidine1409-2'-O)-methyltransferase
MAKNERIDILLVEKGLADSRTQAQRLVMAGQVRVDGQMVHKASRRVRSDATVVVDQGPRFVSRGGEKLAAALQLFEIFVMDQVCADVGASTGGFTDCLLQNGAKRVYAIDVGKGQLHWKLRNHPKVIVMERQNARHLQSLPEEVGLITIDVSFISLRMIFPAIVNWLEPSGQVICLVKPQFEAGRKAVGRGGVVRDAETHRQVLHDVIASATQYQLYPGGLTLSPLLGPKGNIEFLLWLLRSKNEISLEDLVASVIPKDNHLS